MIAPVITVFSVYRVSNLVLSCGLQGTRDSATSPIPEGAEGGAIGLSLMALSMRACHDLWLIGVYRYRLY